MVTKLTHLTAGNPYLPLWEHLPDGEPRVFEGPDKPGKYRIYVIGSHDVMFKSYCGPDIRSWSAPVEDLSNWCDEGPIFTYPIGDQWDVMYAPDLVEVKRKDDGMRTIPGSIMGFDPAVFIEYVTDPKDPDYEIGFRAYGFR